MMIRTFEGREVIVAMGSETLVILDQDDPTCRSFIHLDPTQALLLASDLRDKAELILSEAGSSSSARRGQGVRNLWLQRVRRMKTRAHALTCGYLQSGLRLDTISLVLGWEFAPRRPRAAQR